MNYREFILRFVKKNNEWVFDAQSTMKTEDGYITRVIEYTAYERLREQAEKLAKAFELYEPVSFGQGYGMLTFPAKEALKQWEDFKGEL